MKIFKEEKNAETSVFEKLDFDYVLHAIEKHCYIRDNPIEDFSSNPSAVELINQELNYVKELMKSLDNNLVVYYDGLVDFREVVKKIKKESLEYEFEEFVQIYNGVKLCRLLVNWYNKSEKKFEYPQMHELLNNFDLSKFDFTKAIEKVIDFKKLEVKSDASDLLASLRRKKLETERTYQKRFSTLLKQYIKQGILAESPESVHDGKRVLAVNATYKNQVNGIIVGASQSGNIVFMHDNTLMPILYEFSMIDVEEKVEIKRILKELAFLLLKSDDAIEQMSKFTRQLDRWQAKAKFGIKYECTFPKSLQADKIEIKGGRHPKLIDKIKQSEKIVPINFDLSKDQRIMVISGPNAGGKSVALKTFGTLLLMVNHAIPLSVDEGAQLHIFTKVFVDIGDDQSIQDDLSTYSSHLSKMAALLRQKPMETFFLIDEFGKGTDPALGGPIASSILQTLNERKFWGIVTTHYSDLKELAQQEKGLVNAAMTFNKNKT